ncbi:MAG: acyl--CoA ligase [Ectothiorhodospiraceae bacterium]|nr:acyl--CoA ligase [Ectothiorhodospiraceae bacterium]
MHWPVKNLAPMRYEGHYGDRLVRCFLDRPASLDQVFREAVAAAADADALVWDGGRCSYAELDARVDCIAANLARRGIRPGDRVALLLGNCPEFVQGLLAASRLGAIAVPVTIRERGEGLRYILDNCGARALLLEADLAERLPPADALPELEFRFVVGGWAAGAEPFDALLEPAEPLPAADVAEEDTAVILYTSGTTGHPKGAMLTHLSIIHSLIHFEQCLGLRQGERSILAVPASHVTGLVAIILAMVRVAGCTILMRQFDARAFNRLAETERMTYGLLVPAMYNLCLMRADFREHDLSHWRIGAFGGAPMPEATIRRLGEVLPNLVLVNAYGATETTSPTTVMPAGAIAGYGDTVGRVVPCGDVRIMDADGREVAPGEPGEIWISGPMVVKGYWNRPDATRENFIGGYWRSGDIGSIDKEGYVRVFDRLKDMINRGGYKVFSAEVENVLSYHPAVAECAVVARPDPVLGEKVQAFVTLKEGSAATEQEIRDYCAQRLADYQVPDFVAFLEESLPRNPNGKVVKRDLRELATRLAEESPPR